MRGKCMNNICVTGYGIITHKVENSIDFKNVLEKGICLWQNYPHPYQHEILKVSIIENDYDTVSGQRIARYPRAARIAIAAAHEALEMADLLDDQVNRRRIGVVIGSSCGVIFEIEKTMKETFKRGLHRLRPTTVGALNNNSITTAISSFFHFHGPSFTISNSCTSSIDAILLGKMLIETGQLDCCIVGGIDTAVCDIVIGGFLKLNLLLKDSSNIENSGPFGESNQFVLSEGAGILLLESQEHAMKRGAKIFGYVERGAMSQDAVSIFHSDQSGNHMISIIEKVVGDQPITYINSQALGLKENDQIEEYVYKKIFDPNVLITSIKGMIGHALGASGVLQCISALLSFQYGFIPPTIHTKKSKTKDFPIVASTIYQQVDRVLITSHGYGGNNSCLLLSRNM